MRKKVCSVTLLCRNLSMSKKMTNSLQLSDVYFWLTKQHQNRIHRKEIQATTFGISVGTVAGVIADGAI